VNLIGEHTDYNEGFVLPMAIDRYIVMAADRNPNRDVTLHSNTNGETASFSVRGPVTRGEPAWSNYVRGVVAGFQQRGAKVSGFDAVIESTVPYGGGVASSAALEVAAASLLEQMTGSRLENTDKALLCQEAEHKFAGVPCGIMDQLASILGQENQALLLDCRSWVASPVRMDDPGVTVLVINTGVRHKLVEGEYGRRRAQCEEAARSLKVRALRDTDLKHLLAARKTMDPVVFHRARHVITENERTLACAQAIQARRWDAVGSLMYESHASLRDDYQVSCPELDVVVEIAQTIPADMGLIGCRMTGAGFGGCAVALVRTEAVHYVTHIFEENYERKTRNQASIFSSRPGAGARVIKPV
jgi:galactokinase